MTDTVQCTNCTATITQEQANYHYEMMKDFPQQDNWDWCSPECYLSFQKPRQIQYTFLRMRSDLSAVYNKSIRECPPKSTLRHHGGSLTMDQYHGQSAAAPSRATQKRVLTRV